MHKLENFSSSGGFIRLRSFRESGFIRLRSFRESGFIRLRSFRESGFITTGLILRYSGIRRVCPPGKIKSRNRKMILNRGERRTVLSYRKEEFQISFSSRLTLRSRLNATGR
ncbi:hypothetical protein CEXT_83611 [Caerostris extrusa]|uniref:Uncharacterized protein n=1 Tax=Caerostris extrusa TaxID=172846 RepID=A0AAV4PSA5_CAEEX|nr:hypothetical protein CEXT_83611 [Caerostris extrusa]